MDGGGGGGWRLAATCRVGRPIGGMRQGRRSELFSTQAELLSSANEMAQMPAKVGLRRGEGALVSHESSGGRRMVGTHSRTFPRCTYLREGEVRGSRTRRVKCELVCELCGTRARPGGACAAGLAM